MEDVEASDGARGFELGGNRRLFFKQLFRVAGEKGHVVDVPAWFDFREKRNLTTHTYDARKAAEVYGVISGFEREVTDLLARLQARRGEGS